MAPRVKRTCPSRQFSVICWKTSTRLPGLPGRSKKGIDETSNELYKTLLGKRANEESNLGPDDEFAAIAIMPIQLPPNFRLEPKQPTVKKPAALMLIDELEEEMAEDRFGIWAKWERQKKEIEEAADVELMYSNQYGEPLIRVSNNKYISEKEAYTEEGKAKIAAYEAERAALKKSQLEKTRKSLLAEHRQLVAAAKKVEEEEKMTKAGKGKKPGGAKTGDRKSTKEKEEEIISQALARLELDQKKDEKEDAIVAAIEMIVENVASRCNTKDQHLVVFKQPDAITSDDPKDKTLVLSGHFMRQDEPSIHSFDEKSMMASTSRILPDFSDRSDHRSSISSHSRRSSFDIGALPTQAEFAAMARDKFTSTPRRSMTRGASRQWLSGLAEELEDTTTKSFILDASQSSISDDRTLYRTAHEPTLIGSVAAEDTEHEKTLIDSSQENQQQKDTTLGSQSVSNQHSTDEAEKENKQPPLISAVDIKKEVEEGTTIITDTVLTNEDRRITFSTTANTTGTTFRSFFEVTTTVGGRTEATRMEGDYVYFLQELDLQPDASFKDVLCRVCEQDDYLDWRQLPKDVLTDDIKKLGEGTYGEVFATKYRGKNIALKVVPLNNEDGNSSKEVNGDNLTTFMSVMTEIMIARELTNLNKDMPSANATSTFCQLTAAHIIKGKFPAELGVAWGKFKAFWDAEGNEDKAINDDPRVYGDDAEQLWALFAFELGGKELEDFEVDTSKQLQSILAQLTLALAVAEAELEFEHRDLHISNVLIEKTAEKTIEYSLDFTKYNVKTHGVRVKIIDYTLSHISLNGTTFYRNLAYDTSLFEQPDTNHFKVYKLMKKFNKNDWQKFTPYTNCLWMEYLGIELLTNKKRTPRDIGTRDMTHWKKALTEYKNLSAITDVFGAKDAKTKKAAEAIFEKVIKPITEIIKFDPFAKR